MDEDTKTCEKIHPCDTENKAGCEHICQKKNEKAVCKCKPGYTLKEDGKSCRKGGCRKS